MFCDKTGVNQLTALLASHGFRDIVVCPGSRNGALVHNFHQCREIFTLHSVTDERSAAFVAIGIYLSERKPVALCVTSGSALLNTLPGVAEAYFRHVPLLVISADRPAERIGQLDGQTLFQPDALKPYAASYNLPETDRPQDCRLRNRLINEAILSMQHNGKRPVHINVPLTEPLFTFSTTGLPAERIICEIRPTVAAAPLPEDLTARIARAHFPVLLIGQYEEDLSAPLRQFEENASLLVLPELIGNSSYSWRTNMLEEIISGMRFAPDMVIHAGGNQVNKLLKFRLRETDGCEVIRIEESTDFPDTFDHLSVIVRSSPLTILPHLAEALPANENVRRMQRLLAAYRKRIEDFQTDTLSDLSIMKMLCDELRHSPISALHLGNSSVVRNALYFFDKNDFPVYCNRGTNGIEGSVSVACGYSLKKNGLSLLLVGDLSFFYDQNALWIQGIGGNLRIVLFNNGGGQIFHSLQGLSSSPSRDRYIAASHQCAACGIARSYGLGYFSINTLSEAQETIRQFLTTESDRPVLLEVFTDPRINGEALENMHNCFRTIINTK